MAQSTFSFSVVERFCRGQVRLFATDLMADDDPSMRDEALAKIWNWYITLCMI